MGSSVISTAGKCLMRVLLAAIILTGAGLGHSSAQTAGDELSDAVKNLKALHMNSSHVDWPALEANAQQMIAEKSKPSEAYPAILFLIKALGEKHTHLISADAAAAMRTGAKAGSFEPPISNWPEGYTLTGRIGLLKLPQQYISAEQEKYRQAVRSVLNSFSEANVCRVIVDLRNNSGGSMAPMPNGVAPLLGGQPYGYWVDPSGRETAWTFQNSMVESELSPDTVYSKLPVAILVNGRTASAAEDTLIAFSGRAKTRVFGQATAGFVTSNMLHILPDGALLAISTGWISDRLHNAHKTQIIPDQITEPGQATVDAAIAWLESQDCREGRDTSRGTGRRTSASAGGK